MNEETQLVIGNFMKKLELITSRLEAIGIPLNDHVPVEEVKETSGVPAHVKDFDSAIGESMEEFSKISEEIGGDLIAAHKKVVSIFESLREFLWFAAGSVEPGQEKLGELLKPIGDKIGELSQFKDSKRSSKQFHHLSAMAEGIPSVSWVVVKKTPVPYAKEMLEASMFYINRILREFKGVDQKQVEWAASWKKLLEQMIKFVQKTHLTGLVWNSSPGNLPGAKSGSPPPPPLPPADFFQPKPDVSARNSLFAALNQGEGITSGLKKVSAAEQTHKNPALRGNVNFQSKKQVSEKAQKPSKLACEDGKRWVIEYFNNDKNIVVEVTDKKQAIYVFKCDNSVIKVNGKANSVTLDNCKKTSIVFDSLVAQCETINCQSVQIQTLGEMPTLSIQKTDGCLVYLSPASLNAEIVTSKSSEMNVLVPKEDGDYTEFPIPEQFKTTYVDGKMTTTISEMI